MNINNINSFENECYGCEACSNICPKNAIELKKDKQGFFYPEVLSDKCIDCSACYNICPIINDVNVDKIKEHVYIGNVDNIKYRKMGSSGGIFPFLSNIVLKNHGVVYGAIFDSNSKSILHSSTNDVEIKKIYRSKYSQSRILDSYRKVKQDLNLGKVVLYSGTPCQIAGLKLFLKRDYSKLITVDFVCHGVPSPGIFSDILEIEEKKSKKELIDISFREKDLGWRNQHVKLYWNDTTNTTYQSSIFPFYVSFVESMILRKSCFTCKFSDNHVSDITLADNWYLAKDDLGSSVIKCNTAKGISVLGKIIDDLNCIKISDKDVREQFKNRKEDKSYSLKRREHTMRIYEKYGCDHQFFDNIKRYQNQKKVVTLIKYIPVKIMKTIKKD